MANGLLTLEVNLALHQVNITDRQAMFVIDAMTQALSIDLDSIPVSRSTNRQSRMARRKAKSGLESFSTEVPLFCTGMESFQQILSRQWTELQSLFLQLGMKRL